MVHRLQGEVLRLVKYSLENELFALKMNVFPIEIVPFEGTFVRFVCVLFCLSAMEFFVEFLNSLPACLVMVIVSYAFFRLKVHFFWGGLCNVSFFPRKWPSFTMTWNSKEPVFYGCSHWMIPNHYIKNGCFTISIH